jgi:hypothetical protein
MIKCSLSGVSVPATAMYAEKANVHPGTTKDVHWSCLPTNAVRTYPYTLRLPATKPAMSRERFFMEFGDDNQVSLCMDANTKPRMFTRTFLQYVSDTEVHFSLFPSRSITAISRK